MLHHLTRNHGYAVDNTTLGAGWEQLFHQYMNDSTNEGIQKQNETFLLLTGFHPKGGV